MDTKHTRKESLTNLKLCRFCLSPGDYNNSDSLLDLYDQRPPSKKDIALSLKILSCISVEVFPSDKMPPYICQRCKYFMDLFYSFKEICRQADSTILKFVQNGHPIEPMTWRQDLIKAYATRKLKTGTKSNVVKTIVEGGTTVEVSAQDTDSEDWDEYKVKQQLDDGEEALATIKIGTEKETLKRKSKEAVLPGQDEVSQGCWPCDECHNTFPLQQMLELHKIQRHRERTVACGSCDAKFFNKYDRTVHFKVQHTDEMPFECVVCERRFSRQTLLQRHEKVKHASMLNHHCPSCPAAFVTAAALATHQQRHRRPGVRPYGCDLCEKRFFDHSGLQRHKDGVHSTTPALCCEYCPERFRTVPKLARHVRTHANDRLHPCKFCSKSFVKSHHLYRHIRLKHREQAAEPTGEQYRCEQCEDTFGTQDELIYHSAIHATQNLTCPLCQEKFANVDAVTAHIKSHVNGTEYQCDLCELVFTTKAKLDTHLIAAHEEEVQALQEMEDANESSMDVDEDEENIHVKEENGEMVVEIKKPSEFMLSNLQETESEGKNENTNSEESESEAAYMEMAAIEPLANIKKSQVESPPSSATKTIVLTHKPAKPVVQPATPIVRKPEVVKRKIVQQPTESEKEKPAVVAVHTAAAIKTDGGNSGGASDKSLRLLEKELQELKRTTVKNDTQKTVAKSSEPLRSRRPQLHTSTPKLRSTEEKKAQPSPKPSAAEKRAPERRAVKENKEPKESKEVKENKEVKSNGNDKEKSTGGSEKEPKENETPKSTPKNVNTDKSPAEEGIRRSTRPSKVKDYAKMIRDKPGTDDDTDDDDDEYVETEKPAEQPRKGRRVAAKPAPKAAAKPATAKKRGRPRKEPITEALVPAKIRKDDTEDEDNTAKSEQTDSSSLKADSESKIASELKTGDENNDTDGNKPAGQEQKAQPNVIVSPSVQTLKKVPIKSLPPGVKPLPLPANARSLGPGELCEMQIGKKVVKVQKIVMTKAEVEAMTKRGLLEMKDGTMVLKQGIKFGTDPAQTLKSTLVGQEVSKESPAPREKPSRCNLDDKDEA